MPEFRQLGLVSYEQAWKLQLDLVSDRAEGRVGDTILLAEHFPVFTLGRKTPGVREAVAQPTEIEGVPVFPVERGGEATFHGPGQAVLYPIFHLDLLRSGPRKFLRMLEESIVTVVQSYGLDAFWLEGKTGVWLLDSGGRERKLASLGIAVRRSVSYHGLALNVSTDLSYFRLIQPCGFAPDVMTSMKAELGIELSVEEVQARLAQVMAERFQQLQGNL
jgi:lipoyl(octanoyl) transferase